jgi:hypothetical protein
MKAQPSRFDLAVVKWRRNASPSYFIDAFQDEAFVLHKMTGISRGVLKASLSFGILQ